MALSRDEDKALDFSACFRGCPDNLKQRVSLLKRASFTDRSISCLPFLGYSWVLGLRNILNSFLTVFLPSGDKELVDMIYRKRYPEKGPRIAVVGGGTGFIGFIAGA